jgi:predicted metal-binding membrane protein
VTVQRPTAAPAVGSRWWAHENLLPGLLLVLVTLAAWVYTLGAASMSDMSMPMDGGPRLAEVHHGASMSAEHASAPTISLSLGGLALFLSGWGVMMVAMMLPSALPLVLLFHRTERRRLPRRQLASGFGALLGGYFLVWTTAGVPVYGYNAVAVGGAPAMALLPGLLLIAGGLYQFTALKHSCHSRCSSPAFFLARQWRPGTLGATRMGMLHGIDCLGCCAGLMVALIALGMMNMLWMLTAAILIFIEKTAPGGHRLARPVGAGLVVGGIWIIGTTLISGRGPL